MPVGVQCTRPVGVGQQRGELVGVGALDPRLGEALAQGAGQRGAAVLVEVDDDEVVGAEGQQRIGDGHPRSPGTELDDLADRLARQPGADRGGEAGGVGVVARPHRRR